MIDSLCAGSDRPYWLLRLSETCLEAGFLDEALAAFAAVDEAQLPSRFEDSEQRQRCRLAVRLTLAGRATEARALESRLQSVEARSRLQVLLAGALLEAGDRAGARRACERFAGSLAALSEEHLFKARDQHDELLPVLLELYAVPDALRLLEPGWIKLETLYVSDLFDAVAARGDRAGLREAARRFEASYNTEFLCASALARTGDRVAFEELLAEAAGPAERILLRDGYAAGLLQPIRYDLFGTRY